MAVHFLLFNYSKKNIARFLLFFQNQVCFAFYDSLINFEATVNFIVTYYIVIMI